jgi:hypothetical protein
MELKDIDKSSATYWSLGNDSTQKVNNLSFYYVVEHLKLLYLLSDKVLASGSYYFESEIARQVTKELQALFENREILYFIDEDIENFSEHGAVKRMKTPKTFEAYKDKDLVKKRGKELDSFAVPLKRPPSSISDKIVELWIRELSLEDPESLGGIIKSTIKDNDNRKEIVVALKKFASERKKDFVWEYLQPYLVKLKLKKLLQNSIRRKLSKLYAVATAEILGVSLDTNELSYKKYITENTKYDTCLFDECMSILGIRSAIQNLNIFDLIKLKSSNEFIFFREFYFSLVESVSYNSHLASKVLPLLIDAESIVVGGSININVFLNSFSKYCKKIKISPIHYKKPLDRILNRYEIFNKATISPFLEIVTKVNVKKPVNYINNTITNCNDYYIEHKYEIEKVINDKFQIPKTELSGRFGEMSNTILKWFDNFKISEYPLALLILQNLRYFSENDVNELLDKMSEELKRLFYNDFSDVNFFGLGDYSSDSGKQFLYRLRQRLGMSPENFPPTYSLLSPKVKSAVFIDDLIGSGNQATNFFNQKLVNLKLDKYYFSLLAFEDGINNILKNTGFKDVFTIKLLSKSDKAFSENSEIFREEKQRTLIKDFAQKYGRMLYPKGPLGYDDCQALIVFSHNTPNNTLPIIWASNKNEKKTGVSWNPLFERTKLLEKKK